MTKTKTLTEGTPWKQILLFSIPIFWGNVFQLLYSLVDTKIVGSTLGTEALAAVGSVSTLHTLMTGFLNGLTLGFSLITAMCFGAKQGTAEEVLCDSNLAWGTDHSDSGGGADDFSASGAESVACAAGAV